MNILIIQQRNWAVSFGSFLADRLKKRGHKIGCVTLKKSTHNYFLNNGYNTNIWSHDEIIDNPKKYTSKCKYSLDEISDYLNINSVWELIQSQRNLVKDYNKKYFYSFKQAVSDEYIADYIKSCFGMISEIFETFKPQIIISPVLNSFLHAMLNLYCEKNNIPIIGTTDSKVDNINIFTNSYLDNKGKFIDYLKKIREKKISIDYDKLVDEEKFITNKLFEIKSVNNIDVFQKITTKYILNQIKMFLRSFKFKNNVLGSTQDLSHPIVFMRDLFLQHYYEYKGKSFKYDKLEKLENFAFMPLLLQPEENIDLISTRFNNQIETARLVAMSLPANMQLIIKDHPHMLGKRSTSYLEKIKYLPNVKIINSSIPNWKIFKKSKVVIAVSGTSVFEASILGTPTIQLGNLGTIRMLPNVYHIKSLEDIKEKIGYLMKNPINKKENHTKMLEYIHAAFVTGQKNNISKDDLYLKYSKEIERLTNLKV